MCLDALTLKKLINVGALAIFALVGAVHAQAQGSQIQTPPSAQVVEHGPPSAAEIILSSSFVRPSGSLELELRGDTTLTDVTLRFTELGEGADQARGPAQAIRRHVEKALGRVNRGQRQSVQVQLPAGLVRASQKVKGRRGKKAEAESKLFHVQVVGKLPSGESAYSAEMIAFEPKDGNSFVPLTLTEYLKRNGGHQWKLNAPSGKVAPDAVATGRGQSSAAEVVHDSLRVYPDSSWNGSTSTTEQVNGLPSTMSIEATGDGRATISGYVRFEDSNGAQRPMPYAEVTVGYYGGDPRGTRPVTTLTSSTGYYELTIIYDDPLYDSLEMYLQVRPANSYVSVAQYDDGGDPYPECYYRDYFWDHRNGCGLEPNQIFSWLKIIKAQGEGEEVLQNRTDVISGPSRGAAQIFAWMNEAANFTHTAFDPGQAKVVWPRPGHGGASIPNRSHNLIMAATSFMRGAHDISFHEFGHLTMYRRNGYINDNVGGKHGLHSRIHPAFAWSEGWATGYAQFVRPDGVYNAYGCLSRDQYDNCLSEGYFSGLVEDAQSDFYPPNTDDQHNEMWVAAAVNDFYDYGEPSGNDDPADRIVSFSQIMRLIDNHNLDSIIEFYEEMLSSGYLNQREKHQASRVMRANDFDVPLEPETLPMSVSITGDGYLQSGEQGYWSASVSNANGGVSYAWSYRMGYSGSFVSTGSNSSSLSRSFYTSQSSESVTLKMVASSGGETATDFYTLTVTGSGGGGCSDPTVFLCEEEPFAAGMATHSTSGSASSLRGTPEAFALEGNYPNPVAQGRTQIRFSLPEATHVRLALFDMRGREVVSVVDQQVGAGFYRARVDVSNLSSGVYLYRLRAGNFTGTGKMVVVK